jgi:phosphoglucosamine mutase
MLFGTDGVRGQANVELTPELAVAVGRAAGIVLARPRGRAVLGRDTRRSGPMLEAALVAGLNSAGIDVLLADVVPTPAISFLIKDERVPLGIVVSASHNPPEDNGIKLFDANGLKLSEAVEQAVARRVADPGPPRTLAVGRASRLTAAAERYAAFLTGAMETDDVDLQGLTIVVDCAHGATGAIAPRVLEHFNAKVIGRNTSPQGERINDRCGVADLTGLRQGVVDHRADLGIAFDGDGDRILIVTSHGDVLDGDAILGIAAGHLHRAGRLHPPVVVSTILSNRGLEDYLGGLGVSLRRTPVGDRYVARTMHELGAQLGGEKSGHIIFGDHSRTGDGILTAVRLLEIAHAAERDLADLAGAMPMHPQEERNVPVVDPVSFLHLDEVDEAIREARRCLGSHGRLVVRASGTQPILRIMVESSGAGLCSTICQSLGSALEDLASSFSPSDRHGVPDGSRG